MPGRRVVCVGELLFDVAPDGAELPGGAPANVAFHAVALGCDAHLVSRTGCDERGRKLQRWLQAARVHTAGLQEDRFHATGAVTVRFAGAEPSYDIAAPAAWDFIEDGPSARSSVHGARVAVFGTLAQRSPVSRRSLRSLVTLARESGCMALADLNLRAPFYDAETVLWTLRHCDVLKMNAGEVRIVSNMLGARGSETDLFSGLLREFGIPRGVLTCGEEGSWAFDDGNTHHEPAAPAHAVDSVGAGDAFTSVLAAFLAHGLPLRAAALFCAEAAAFVCSCRGATPDLPQELIKQIRSALR